MTVENTEITAELARIATLPLAERSAAFLALHAQLSEELERSDSVHG